MGGLSAHLGVDRHFTTATALDPSMRGRLVVARQSTTQVPVVHVRVVRPPGNEPDQVHIIRVPERLNVVGRSWVAIVEDRGGLIVEFVADRAIRAGIVGVVGIAPNERRDAPTPAGVTHCTIVTATTPVPQVIERGR